MKLKALRRGAARCFAMLAFALAPAAAHCAPAPVSAESISYKPESALIKAFVLVAGRETGARYSLVAGADEGVKTLQISSGDKILNRKECYGAPVCRIEGANAKAELAGDVLTVEATSSTNREQREKVRMNFESPGDKVYSITALPGMTGSALIASNPGISTETVEPQATGTVIQLPPQDTGPVITRTVKKTENGAYSVMVLAADPSGVDFIELLENGRFLDVQTCEGMKQCRLDRTIRLDAPGEYKYTIKSMDKLGKVSFQDFPVSSED